MTSHTLIFLGKGATHDELPGYLERHPQAALWTLNQATHPQSELHFDIHHDQRFWSLLDALPKTTGSIVSPFHEREGSITYPLHRLHETFGTAYLESTICYMAAYAALLQHEGLFRFERLCLPGCDMADAVHFAYRSGLHFWLGVLRGQGTALDIPAGSYVLQRKPSVAVGPTEVNFPHIYGQPLTVTQPHAKKYNWPVNTH